MNEDEELVTLRISVALLAQAMDVDNNLQLGAASYEQLSTIAKTQPRGWNDLVARMVDQVVINRNSIPVTLGELAALEVQALVVSDAVNKLLLALENQE